MPGTTGSTRRRLYFGLGLLLLLAVPYLRFSLTQGQARLQHLIQLNSYWIKPIPFYEKVLTYFARYLKGLNPFYWFWPNPSLLEKFWPDLNLPLWLFSNQADLARHTMKGYGHIFWVTLPLWVYWTGPVHPPVQRPGSPHINPRHLGRTQRGSHCGLGDHPRAGFHHTGHLDDRPGY